MKTWEILLERALCHLKKANLPEHSWRFGGGTVLMFEFNHRESKDIDIFVSDRQVLSYLTPRINDALEDSMTYYAEHSEFIRLTFTEGEIDFICAPPVTDIHPRTIIFQQSVIEVDHPIEIVAKKIKYRADKFKPRDVFDLAMLTLQYEKKLVSQKSLFLPYIDMLSKRLDELNKSGFLRKGIDELQVLDGSKLILGQEYHLCKNFTRFIGHETNKTKQDLDIELG